MCYIYVYAKTYRPAMGVDVILNIHTHCTGALIQDRKLGLVVEQSGHLHEIDVLGKSVTAVPKVDQLTENDTQIHSHRATPASHCRFRCKNKALLQMCLLASREGLSSPAGPTPQRVKAQTSCICQTMTGWARKTKERQWR